MEGTPRLKKRNSLTLGRYHKRCASSRILQGQTRSKAIPNDSEDFTRLNAPISPSVSSLSSDVGIEGTPPHKKINLDDSADYTPKCFDTSFSPSLLSQTFSSNSPEVGWKWGRRSMEDQIETGITTPDSAYAADSSFTSGASSSVELINAIGRIRSESHSQRFVYEMRREEQRRKMEIQMRRAEKLRADELLKQRCAILEVQLREAEERCRQDIVQIGQNPTQPKNQETASEQKIQPEQSETTADLAAIEDIFAKSKDTFDDFFNDSDSDGLLLQATQQVETEIIELTQKSTTENPATSMKTYNFVSENTKLPKEDPASEQHEKRSSLYLKFLEDDSPDDWFLSLDDAILQASQQTKKPRNNLQRHNSMPANTLASLNTGSRTAQTTTTMASSTLRTQSSHRSIASTSTSVSSSKIKRHASSHALSRSSGAVNSSQQLEETHLSECKNIVRKIIRRQILKRRRCRCKVLEFRR